MACMCGDFCCPSCGPAQGNYHCPICICNEWASEGCDHLDENGVRPEFQAQAEEIARQEHEAEEKLVKDLEEAERLAEEYWRSQE